MARRGRIGEGGMSAAAFGATLSTAGREPWPSADYIARWTPFTLSQAAQHGGADVRMVNADVADALVLEGLLEVVTVKERPQRRWVLTDAGRAAIVRLDAARVLAGAEQSRGGVR